MNLEIVILPIAFLIVSVIMSIITSGKFLTTANISAMAYQLPELGFFSLAMMIAMVTGGIDLSVISSANLVGVIIVFLSLNFIPEDASTIIVFLLIFLIVIIGMCVSLFLGMINGTLIAYVNVSPVLTTLGTMILYEGVTLTITKGIVLSGLPDIFLVIGNNSILGIPIPFIIFIICVLIFYLFFGYGPFGKYLLMVGSNKEAAKYSGINVKKVLLKTYMLSGFFAGLASIVMVSRFNSANARYGTSYMLLSILIVVLGGTDPSGGYARIGGVVMALFTLQALNSGFNMLGVNSYVTVSLWGVILVLVILYNHYVSEKRKKWMSDIAKNK
jgi:ribose/xylose/arabinose/galactoside ABC-type transport system permease subunit